MNRNRGGIRCRARPDQNESGLSWPAAESETVFMRSKAPAPRVFSNPDLRTDPAQRSAAGRFHLDAPRTDPRYVPVQSPGHRADRKSTRLNSRHITISYAVFSLKKK